MSKQKQTRIWYEEVPIEKVDAEENVRTEVGDVAGLMTSIDQQGLLHPIGVYETNGRYRLRYGNRRFKACSNLGWKKIPAMVSNKELTNDNYRDFLLENFSENKNRKDTSPVEDGRLFVELQDERKMSISEVSAATGIAESYIRKAINTFLKTPKEYRNYVGFFTGRAKKKGAFSQEIIIMATRSGISKEETKKILDYAKSHDEATINNIRLIIRLMERRSSNALTFQEAVKKVNKLKVYSLQLVVRKSMEKLAKEEYGESLHDLMIDVLTGKKKPVKGLIYSKLED